MVSQNEASSFCKNYITPVWDKKVLKKVGNLRDYLYHYKQLSVACKAGQKNTLMITHDKITEIFCAVNEFCKEFEKQMDKNLFLRDVIQFFVVLILLLERLILKTERRWH